MSDPPNLASQLEKKFDYINTFYHQPPTIDITNPPETEWGRYDFIISSEVMEHVPPPIENGFANLYRLLKPNGVLLLTVPYRIDWPHEEHYPELHEYALANLGGKTVLVNRRRDGVLETFENLCFHGGGGSTLELRVFSEESLKTAIRSVGFDDVHVAAEAIPEFGVEHTETWSLPIVARKGKIQLPVTTLAKAYRDAIHYQHHLSRENQILRDRSQVTHRAEPRESLEQVSGGRNVAELERLLAASREEIEHATQLIEERTKWAQARDKDYDELLAQIKQLRARKWLRIGRKLGIDI